jgi:hypothetical protein
MKFFVPAAQDPEQAEEVYKNFAEEVGTLPIDLEHRIYAIRFEHDGEEFEARVGDHITGKKSKDNAIVLAIFDGDPYRIVTSQLAGHASEWHNPVYVGLKSVKDVERFTAD